MQAPGLVLDRSFNGHPLNLTESAVVHSSYPGKKKLSRTGDSAAQCTGRVNSTDDNLESLS